MAASGVQKGRRSMRLALLLLAAAVGCADAGVRKGVSAECRNTSDCPGGLICSRGICEDVNPSLHCHDDGECPTGQDCLNGYCEAPRGGRTPPQTHR
jgi:hypothetical protein